MKIAIKNLALSVSLLLFCVPLSVCAHGAGAFFETTVGNFIVDIGFSSPAPEVGESVVFDFQIRKVGTSLTSGSDTDFSDVWVRIESEEKTLLATGLYNAEFGGPRLSYVFPKEGEYTIYARYENGSESLAETSFPMTVVPNSNGQGSHGLLQNALYGGAGLIVGLLLAVLSRKYIRL
jgi:hypothetical protein